MHLAPNRPFSAGIWGIRSTGRDPRQLVTAYGSGEPVALCGRKGIVQPRVAAGLAMYPDASPSISECRSPPHLIPYVTGGANRTCRGCQIGDSRMNLSGFLRPVFLYDPARDSVVTATPKWPGSGGFS